MNNHKKQISRIRIIKWIISLIALWFLYYEIFVRHDAIALLMEYKDTIRNNTTNIFLILLLMPINWLIETFKWYRLLDRPQAMSPFRAFQGVLMGVALGLFTPNGVGEFAGRVWVVNDKYRERAVSSSIVGSIAQLCITITIGGAFVVFFTSQFIVEQYLVLAQVLAAITILIGLVAYYKMPQIAAKVLSKIKFFKRYEQFSHALTTYTKRSLSEAYLWSFIRYSTFCTQLAILLIGIGGVEPNDMITIVTLIPVYYYIQTIIPTVALSEIGVRGMILLFLFSNILVESEVILISFLIWIINLIVPGLIGLFLLARTRFVKQ